MRAISPADLQKWLPRDLLAVDLPAFGKWMLTLAVSIFVVGAASTGTLNLISNYAVRPANTAVPAQSPAAQRSMEPVQLIAPATAAEVDPAATAVSATATGSAAATPTAAADESVSGQAKMMAALSLAVRAHPQKGSAQIGALQQGEIVSIAGSEHGWYLVTTSSGVSGWSWGKYLEPVDPQVAADSPFWSAQGQDVAFAR